MSFTLPRGGGPPPILRILKSNITIRPRLPVNGSGLYIKSFSFSSHAVLSRLRTSNSTNQGKFGVSRRPGCVNFVTDMHRQCMQGVRLSSTLDEAVTEKEGTKQERAKDEATKVEQAEKEADEETHEEVAENLEEEAQQDWDKAVPVETDDEYKARFPAIHDIVVKRITGEKGKEDVEKSLTKAYLTLHNRKHNGRKPRVWVSISEEKIPADIAGLEWPAGKQGVTKATILDWEESGHDLKFKWPLGKFMEYQVVEKTLVKGNRRIWREVVQKRKGDVADGDKGEKE